MSRAHILRPVLDINGNVLSDIQVKVYEPGTTTLINEPIFLDSVTPTAVQPPITFANGVISIYLDAPKRVRIGVKKGVLPEFFFEDIDILNLGSGSKITVGAGLPVTTGRLEGDEHFDNTDPAKLKQYVLTGNPLAWFELKGTGFRSGAGTGSIIGGDLDSPATADGQTGIAIGSGAAANGTNSIAIGQNTTSHGGSSTAVGQQAVASDDSASAFGQQATASNLSATALGASSYVSDAGGTAVGNSAAAIGPDAVAIGHNALTGRSNLPPTDPANDQNLAIGNTTEARGGQSTAVGSQAQANFAHTTSLGWASYSSVDGTALGHQATAGPRGVALGKDASAANDQGLIKVNELEVQPSGPGSTDSTLALHGGTGGAKHAIGVNDKGLTFDGQPYPPVPAPVADPETGETTTVASVFSVQTIVSGDLVVAPNIVKPGLRVVQTSTAHTIVARVDTVPTGASIVIVVERWNGGTYANDIGTVTIAAGTSLGVVTGLAVACAKGDIVKFRCTQIGSTVAGADINLSVDFK